jgi:excisionase family DNA binding protein
MNQKATRAIAEPSLYDADQTAAYLSVSVRTVHTLMEKKLLRPVRIPGVRALRFRKSHLDAVIASWSTEQTR